jgi:predicted ribosome quality control (RQC) complex YloA/Tae2 family protein
VDLSEAKAMSDLVTENELARARNDPAFRQQFLAQNLDRLIEALKKMRRVAEQTADTDRQLREGADLAVKLADRLQSGELGPRAA